MDDERERLQVPDDVAAAVVLSLLVIFVVTIYGTFVRNTPDGVFTGLDLAGFAIAALIWVALGVFRLMAWMRQP